MMLDTDTHSQGSGYDVCYTADKGNQRSRSLLNIEGDWGGQNVSLGRPKLETQTATREQ